MGRACRLRRPRCLLCGPRGHLGHACRFSDSLSLGSGRASQIFGPASLGGAALVFFEALRRDPFVFIATVLVAALLFLAPLSRAPLLLIAPPRRATLLFFASLLLETLSLAGSRYLRGAAGVLSCLRRSRCALGLEGGALGVCGSIRASRTRSLLGRAHRILRGADRIGCALRFSGAFGLGSPRGSLSRAHCLLSRARGLGCPLGLLGSFRIGLLLRESLLSRYLARLFGGARRVFGRALRLFGCPSSLRRPLRLCGELRIERAARFLLSGARFVLGDARLFLRGLGLRRRGIGFARGVGDGSGLAPYVFE